MLGSDYPLGSGSLEDALRIVQDASLTEAERELVLGANAVRVFNLPVRARAITGLGSPARVTSNLALRSSLWCGRREWARGRIPSRSAPYLPWRAYYRETGSCASP